MLINAMERKENHPGFQFTSIRPKLDIVTRGKDTGSSVDNFSEKNDLGTDMTANIIIGKERQAAQKRCYAVVLFPPCPTRLQPLNSKGIEQN